MPSHFARSILLWFRPVGTQVKLLTLPSRRGASRGLVPADQACLDHHLSTEREKAAVGGGEKAFVLPYQKSQIVPSLICFLGNAVKVCRL